MKAKLIISLLLCSLNLNVFANNIQPIISTKIEKQLTSAAQPIKPACLQDKLVALEVSFGGRIGIDAINTLDGKRIQYRAEERFPIQSTFKLMEIAAILKQSMNDPHLLLQKIDYSKKELVSWSPITEKHLGKKITVIELCAAAMMYSDNTATNLLMKKLGGPEAVNAFARSIGDRIFRIDNWEPELNSNPSDLHDTSTPAAMEKSLLRLVLGNVLAPKQRNQLIAWMKANTTGDTRIRMGVPKGWIVADKTGAGTCYGVSNDIAIIWPPKAAPIVLAIYTVQNKKEAKRRDDVVVAVTRLLIDELTHNDKRIRSDQF